MPEVSIVTKSAGASRDEAQTRLVCTWKAAGLNAAWVLLAGELDLASSAQLKETLREAQHRARVVVLDLRKLTFIDSSGVYVVLNAACGARREGGRLMLVRGPPQVDRLFTLIASSDEVLTVDLDPTQPAKELLDLDRPACEGPLYPVPAPGNIADHAVGREEARRLRDLFTRSPVVRLFGRA
jgi:anti-anti-sigma factor